MFYLKKRKDKKHEHTMRSILSYIACTSDVTNPQCVVCYKTLPNECMKPAKLKRHLMTQHPELTGKPQTFFERKKERIFEAEKSFYKIFGIK